MADKHPDIEAILRDAGLRVTAPRRAIMNLLITTSAPASYSEIQRHCEASPWDQATTYRTLVKLKEAGITKVVSRADGIDRYVYAAGIEGEHDHAHFECDDCGRVECLPANLEWKIPVRGKWSKSVRRATVQLRGVCPDCLSTKG